MKPKPWRRIALAILLCMAASGRAEEKSTADQALEEALRDLPSQPAQAAQPSAPGLYSRALGPANLRLIDISLDGLFAVGTSTEPDAEIQDLQAGGHDPRKRGFTIQNVELSLPGAVDP